MYVKYPPTPHLPWSHPSKDDVTSDLSHLSGPEVVVTEKIDGANTTITGDRVHGRSIDSRNRSEALSWMKGHAAQFQHDIPKGYRIVGENVFIPHAITYAAPVYFYGISAWKGAVCLGWLDTLDLFEELGITPVPTLWSGYYSKGRINTVHAECFNENTMEGYVVRYRDSFSLSTFQHNVAKYVRKGHVWVPNEG